MKIEFGLHHTSGMTCQLLVTPSGCGTLPTYGNLKVSCLERKFVIVTLHLYKPR